MQVRLKDLVDHIADVLGHTITAGSAERAALALGTQGREELLLLAQKTAAAMSARDADVSADVLKAELQPRAQLLAGSMSIQVRAAVAFTMHSTLTRASYPEVEAALFFV